MKAQYQEVSEDLGLSLTRSQIFGMFVSLVFLGQAFTIMLVYIWSRRNPNVRMNFFGLLNFQAPFLPWVLMGFSLLLGNSIIVDLLGQFQLVVLTVLEVLLDRTERPESEGQLKFTEAAKILFYRCFRVLAHILCFIQNMG